MKKLRET